jgi:hydrogenase maturation protein HypF
VTAAGRRRVTVRGVVQGVGFRPFVYRLARDHGLAGWVLNHSGGVDLEVEGPGPALDAFVVDLKAKAPPLARIVGVEVQDLPPSGYTRFEIRHSVAVEGHYQLISPDIATCPDCLSELLDPADRRYRYPFTNCTNCGPRFTIIRDIPYDRPLTTMGAFAMCPDCQREYDDPLNRRFHAQPNACPACGPRVRLEEAGATELAPDPAAADAIAQAAGLLRSGTILALKGLGGFHLACDATDPMAVQTLRRRKGRPAKPLAVMLATLDEVRLHCDVSEEEAALLSGPQCPIVLLRWHESSTVARDVAPGNGYLGVMLPYTPLHHVLLRDAGRPLVMTSGNLSEEPIAQHNDEARRRLAPLADAFLLHNRDIYARYDDSVWFVPGRTAQGAAPRGHPTAQPIRRSRGYAPFPVQLPFQARPILAVGAELKNTFCLARDDFAFLSQHIGDMENLETLEHFEASIALYEHLFRVEPEVVAHDLHPDYLSTRYAQSKIENPESRLAIQHHHAHAAACLADNGWQLDQGPVLAVVWDGTGYGLDGHIWGGEFLVGDYRGFRRAAHLEYLPLPGGDAAIHNPWRLAVGYAYALTGAAPALPGVSAEELRIVCQQVDRGLNTPRSSAAGRLFDAVAALAGVGLRVSYEAQAAIELEMLATEWAEGSGRAGGSSLCPAPGAGDDADAYPFDVEQAGDLAVIRLRRLVEAVQADAASGAGAGEIGWRFHLTLARLIEHVCGQIAQGTGLRTVALTGGCFQNRLLLGLAVPRLEAAGFRVLLHGQVPCNDGGVSLGQAVLASFAGSSP